MSSQSVVLIVNPHASRVDPEATAAVEAALGRVAAVTTVRTERPGHAVELASVLRGDLDAVVVFSGDGGFNEVLNGLRDPVPIGFVPGGGTSVLPRALGLPRDPREAADAVAAAIAGRRTRRISLGRANGRRFAFTAGVGLDAELVRRVDQRGRDENGKRAGDAWFALTAARMLIERRGRLEPALEVVGLGRAAFALVANADPYTFAGPLPLRIAPRARFELGLDVVAPRRVRPPRCPVCSGTRCSAAARSLPPTSSMPTTSTGSRCGATSRCRCRPTARTSATFVRSCSRPSATPSRCSSGADAGAGRAGGARARMCASHGHPGRRTGRARRTGRRPRRRPGGRAGRELQRHSSWPATPSMRETTPVRYMTRRRHRGRPPGEHTAKTSGSVVDRVAARLEERGQSRHRQRRLPSRR